MESNQTKMLGTDDPIKPYPPLPPLNFSTILGYVLNAF